MFRRPNTGDGGASAREVVLRLERQGLPALRFGARPVLGVDAGLRGFEDSFGHGGATSTNSGVVGLLSGGVLRWNTEPLTLALNPKPLCPLSQGDRSRVFGTVHNCSHTLSTCLRCTCNHPHAEISVLYLDRCPPECYSTDFAARRAPWPEKERRSSDGVRKANSTFDAGRTRHCPSPITVPVIPSENTISAAADYYLLTRIKRRLSSSSSSRTLQNHGLYVEIGVAHHRWEISPFSLVLRRVAALG